MNALDLFHEQNLERVFPKQQNATQFFHAAFQKFFQSK